MSFQKITNKQYRRCASDRMGTEFFKRMAERGAMIDRTQTTRPKNVKTVKAPSALTKFFTPIHYKEAL